MKIINTFVPCLYAIKYPENEIDELERLFDDWENPLVLFEFFEKNEKDIDISIESAIKKVRSEAKCLKDILLKLAKEKPNQLNELFKNLHNSEYKTTSLSKQKAPNRWLRIYAVKIDDDTYLITGGAIKLDQGNIASKKEFAMQDRDHTNDELIKINKCRDFLTEQGVYDAESFLEIFF